MVQTILFLNKFVKQQIFCTMSGAMLASRRSTTSPAVLNKRSLETLVAGMARTNRATEASSG